MTNDDMALAGLVIAAASVIVGLAVIWWPLALIVGGLLVGGTMVATAVIAAMQDARGPDEE